MAKVELRNAYYRGWFAARARRPAPAPDVREEHFFIEMGFAQGRLSSGGPLRLWSKSIEPGLPANLAIELGPDHPIFSTRARQEPSIAPPDKSMSARRHADKAGEAPAAASAADAFPIEDADTEAAERNPHLPEKKPQYKLPSRPAYGPGKRRPTRFAR